jgi:phosphoglycolate phosphatase
VKPIASRPLVVGFDLDMTLVDSADGIVECIVYACSLHGVTVDPAEVHPTVGWPLDLVFPRWVPDVDPEILMAAYRERYVTHVIPFTKVLPGARAAIAAVHDRGGRVLVISAKRGDHVEAVLAAGGLPADLVVGSRFAEAKGATLLEEGAWAYIGDHTGDVVAARHAGALAVAVSTGPTPAEELWAAGADVVLPGIGGFPDWLHEALGRYPDLS